MKQVFKFGKLYLISDQLPETFDQLILPGIAYDETTGGFVSETGEPAKKPSGFEIPKSVLFAERKEQEIDLSQAEKLANIQGITVLREQGEETGWVYTCESGRAWLKVDKDYTRALYCGGAEGDGKALNRLLLLAFQCKLMQMGYLTVRAACVHVDGKAVLFSDPGEHREAAYAASWVEACNAAAIPGSYHVIDPIRGSAVGISLDDSGVVYNNGELPIAVYNQLISASETKLKRMTADEKKQFIAAQLFMPDWDQTLFSAAPTWINQAVGTVSVYRLACDASKSAAKESYGILFPREATGVMEFISQLKALDMPKNDIKYKVNTFIDFKARKAGIPFRGTFELTPLCNLDCKMCYVHQANVKTASLIRPERWKQLMKEAHDAGMVHAKLTGGECLTYPWFDELFLYLQSFGTEMTVFTNGLLLDEKRVAFFMDHPVEHIQVTIYGSNNDAYKKVTGIGCFDLVYKNIMHARNAGLPISLAITPSIFSYEDMPELLKLVNDLGIEYIVNTMLTIPRKETGRQLHDLSTMQYLEIAKLQASIKSELLRPIDPDELPEAKTTGEETVGIKCGAGRSGFCITWDERIAPCLDLLDLGESLKGKNFLEGWRIINQRANTFPLPRECTGCAYQDRCIQCIAAHYDKDHPGYCNKAICERTKLFAEAGL